MAEDQDPSQKTEEPTQKRLDDAAKKGQVAKSQEIGHWFIMLAALISLMMLSPGVARDLQASLRVFLEQPHAVAIDGAAMRSLLWNSLTAVSLAMLPIVGLLWGAALAANLIQHKPTISAHKLKPDFSKLSLIKGAKRLFSTTSLVEFSKGIAKILVVGVVGFVAVFPQFDILEGLVSADIGDLLFVLRDIAIILVAGVLSVITLIAAIDLVYQRYKHVENLRMTKQEVKDEHKQSEGDPMIKQRLRAIRMERSRRRMIAAVPEADVVITNPTHYAIALKYDGAKMAAPMVVAKGQDHLAARIREIADEHDVPKVSNPPLARALYATVEVDQEIPTEHYQAVAEIIGYVMGLNRSAKARA